MRRICVCCGSNSGSDLAYGGADKGIMGVIANAVLASGGKVYGVIPTTLCEKELVQSPA